MHWLTGEERGLYSRPEAVPPTPQARGTNDLSTRLARLEEHIRFSAWDRTRIEQESHTRGKDIIDTLKAIDQRLKRVEKRQDMDRHTERRKAKVMETVRAYTVPCVKYGIALVLFLLTVSGKLTLAEVKPWLSVIGLPAG